MVSPLPLWRANRVFIIASDPARFRPLKVPSVVEKFGYGVAVIVLFLQSRIRATDLVFAATDLVLGLLFLSAFLACKQEPA
jgi:hypothetical protein